VKLRTDSGNIDPMRVIFGLASVIVILFTGFMIYMMCCYNNPPIEFSRTEVLTHEVEAGDIVRISIDMCKHTNSPVTIRRTWADTLMYYERAVEPSVLPKGCYDDLIVAIPVPEHLPAGTYVLRSTLEFETIPIAKRLAIIEFGPIEVVEGDA
jgi:hypothetical protein